MIDLIGREIDHYQIKQNLGSGGMGAVYRAHDSNLNRSVALKVMDPQLARQPLFQRRFLQEAQAAARLDHPSIVKIHDFRVTDSIPYMVMEFISGGSLAGYIRLLQKNNQALLLSDSLLLMAQVADALGYAHRHGIIHRDIKPDNILIKRLDDMPGRLAVRAIVTDFGLAKLLEGGVQTTSGAFMGTLAYMSPEQASGDPPDGRSDIYSLGVMLYQLATGKLPFKIDTPSEAVKRHLHDMPLPPQVVRAGLPDSVADIIDTALAKAPDDRFQSAEEMAEALRLALGSVSADEGAQFINEETAVSLSTLPTPEAPPPPSFIDGIAPAEFDQLIVVHADDTPNVHLLDKDEYSIGRTEENDIVLPASSVSRQHVRLKQVPSDVWETEGWMLIDLGSANGVFLEDDRLLKDIPTGWSPGQKVRIGPYFLYLQKSAEASTEEELVGESTMAVEPVEERQPTVPFKPQLNISLTPALAAITPGERAEIRAELLNNGSEAEQFQLRIDGLPEEWATVSRPSIRLVPGERVFSNITLHPPQNSSAEAGRRTYQLAAFSRGREIGTATGKLTLQPFESFTTELTPLVIRHKQKVELRIRNDGNAATRYAISGWDRENAIEFDGLPGSAEITPGQTKGWPVTVTAQNRPIFGRSEHLPFEIRVSSAAAGRQSRSGQLILRPFIPRRIVAFITPLLLLLCLAGAIVTLIPSLRDKLVPAPIANLFDGDDSSLTEEAKPTVQIVVSTPRPTDEPTAQATLAAVRPTPIISAETNAVHFTAPPQIDGHLGEWNNVQAYASAFPVYTISDWDRSDDLEAAWQLAWDTDNLYIAVTVQDDAHVQIERGNQIFRGDSVEIQVDTDRQGDYAPNLSPDDFQITFSPGDFGGRPASAFRFRATENGRMLDAPDGHNITIASRQTDDGYIIEAAIPWSDLDMIPESGMQIGIALNANDNDSSGMARQEMMKSHVSTRAFSDPTTWGTLTLE